MSARKLSVIILDDKSNPHRLPDGLEFFDKQINSWFRALNFWAHYKGDSLPDLVAADVHFEDDGTSPLARVRFVEPNPNPLPTGLSHLKPLSVLARVSGRPIGIGIYTITSGLWERLTRSGAPQDQCMGYLAAHELGELAAILGEKSPVAEVLETGSFEPLWRWLADSTGSITPEAVKIALSNYRKRLLALASPADGELPQVFVMPDDYAAVMCWCEKMARDEENRPPLAGDADQALTLTYKDGTRDPILISSLFSDVDDIATRPLDAHCFDTSPPRARASEAGDDAEEKWQEFDRKGRPFIGKFLSRLGTLRSAYDEAARIVEAFPCLPPESRGAGDELDSRDDATGSRSHDTEIPVKLGGQLTRKGDDPLVAGLVIVFQLARIEKAVFDLWERYYASCPWEPRGCSWESDVTDYEMSLRNALHLLLNGVRSVLESETDSDARGPAESRAHEASGDAAAQDGCFYSGDVLEEIIDRELPWPWPPKLRPKDAQTEWCRWHFQRLVDARILKNMQGGAYKLTAKLSAQDAHVPTPPLPTTLPRRSGL